MKLPASFVISEFTNPSGEVVFRVSGQLDGKRTVSEMTAAALAEFFKRGNASRKTYNNRRGLISAFLKYCVLKDWVADNVIT
jgi:hypothetical protein